MLVTAFIPRGVAAPPAPNILVAILSDTYSRVLSDSRGNNLFTIGDKSLDILPDSPLASNTAIIPDHIQYTHSSDILKFIPFSTPARLDDRKVSGVKITVKTIQIIVTKNQTLLIIKYYENTFCKIPLPKEQFGVKINTYDKDLCYAIRC